MVSDRGHGSGSLFLSDLGDVVNEMRNLNFMPIGDICKQIEVWYVPLKEWIVFHSTTS